MKPDIPNCFYRVSVKALILDETRTKFLIVQEEDGRWELPGGGLDWGEEPRACLMREIKEEMGLETTWIDEKPSYFISRVQNSKGVDVVNVLYEVKVQNLDFTPSDECIAMRFVTPEEVASLTTFPNIQSLAKMFNPENHISK